MNRRQAKKAYKKRHGYNPPKTEVRFHAKYIGEVINKIAAGLLETVKTIAERLPVIVSETVKNIQTMPDEDFAKFLEDERMDERLKILARAIRAEKTAQENVEESLLE